MEIPESLFHVFAGNPVFAQCSLGSLAPKRDFTSVYVYTYIRVYAVCDRTAWAFTRQRRPTTITYAHTESLMTALPPAFSPPVPWKLTLLTGLYMYIHVHTPVLHTRRTRIYTILFLLCNDNRRMGVM